jgi:putative selenate reductase
MPLGRLLRRAVAEHERRQAIFDLPQRKWYLGRGDVDVSASFHGARASTPLGPAAGPHSQLAQNIVLSWLGGARIVELKTVQVNDTLTIPRPCIDVANVGFNVEWSQELAVQQSIDEYAKAWMLIHLLGDDVCRTTRDARPDTLFDLSVGYDLAGIRTPKVTGFIRAMLDASASIDRQRSELRGDLARFADVPLPSRIADCVTLSTFHGCPADEIEGIADYLLRELGVHVVIKLNPTLLGYDDVVGLLHERLGYQEIRPIRAEFERDLQWEQALALFGRLATTARERGLTLGAKFTNTLVVENHKTFFPGEDRMYLSGPPLYPISLSLALRFREAVGAAFPISFSAGIDQHNFPDAVACGMAPITTCTDLLQPGGYGRLFKYLTNLEGKMRALGTRDLDGYLLAVEGALAAGIDDPREASLHNMRRVVERTLGDPRYSRAKNSAVPRKIGSHLVLFDCISCDKCIPVCPNDANFVYSVAAVSGFSEEAFVRPDGSVGLRPSVPFVVEREHQIGNYADFCNDCGNCDVFCPEDGGPYVEKPRFFGSRTSFEANAQHGGFYLEREAEVVRAWARIDGGAYSLELDGEAAAFSDGTLMLTLTPSGTVSEAAACAGVTPGAGHVLSTHPARAMLAIIRGVLDPASPNPVNASL